MGQVIRVLGWVLGVMVRVLRDMVSISVQIEKKNTSYKGITERWGYGGVPVRKSRR